MMRLYRTLLRLYPASFRNEYAEEMVALFARRRQYASGIGVAALWFETILDVLVNAFAAHADALRQDLRYAIRTFGRSPGFAIAVILIAGLGIGTNVAVFTVTDHALIRPLPFYDSDRLVKLWENKPGYSDMELSPPNFRDWKSASASFETMAAYRGLAANLVGQGEPQRVEGASITADLLPMLGVRPLFGRLFTAEDDRENAPGTLILSYALWQGKFGADYGVLGKKVILDEAPYVIIGVMPRELQFPNRRTEIWTAMRFAPRHFEDRANNYLHVVARLKPSASIEAAREEMRLITARLEREYPRENERTGATVNRLRDEISTRSVLLLTALTGAALCLLLITCTNLASLLLARALSRRKELAIRSSLGAGRERLVRQLVTESLILALAGGVLGVLAAHAALPVLAMLAPQNLPLGEPAIDLRVMIFALALTGITGLGFGVIPAARACANSANLQEGSRSGIGGRRERLRSILVAAEITASFVLLISAGLLIRALARVEATDPGFRSEGILTLRTSLPMPRYAPTARREQFYSRVLSETRDLPGVTHAAFISFLPMRFPGGIWVVNIDGKTQSRSSSNTASLRFVTPGFFSALDIPIRMGRDVSEFDTLHSPFAAVVSESFVRRYWPGENPIGRSFEFAFEKRTIVGVVKDIRVRGLERIPEPQVYLPYKQVRDGAVVWYSPKDLVVRSSGEPAALMPALRRIVRSADPEMPIADVFTMDEIVHQNSAARRLQARLLGGFAAIAVILAGFGIHALLSFSVSTRSQEIGVRMALGAQAQDILAMVLRESFALAATGVILGVGLGYAAGISMESLLFGVSPSDVSTFLIAAALCLSMTLLSSAWPALRAVRVDPARVIRLD